jgi:hypothetical protein
MMNKFLLGSILALFGWTGIARAQAALGSPVAPENNLERSSGTYVPALYEEAQASARRAAVKYLATIDCPYYPEAESGLIAAMRADQVEMVRFEAALALGNCVALTQKALEALNMTALGLELDGNPAEFSERVRGAARISLHRCWSRGLCLPPLAHQMVPAGDRLAPDCFMIRTTGYCVPNFVPAAAPIPRYERDLAETISAKAKNQPSSNGSRSLRQFLFGFTFGREATQETQMNVDPRLRGLNPLGSATLAIPMNPYPPAISPMRPYNYQEW